MIYIMRHGETNFNVEKRVQGHSNNPLSENGVQQAKDAIAKLKTLPIKAIICSDTYRAKQTAEIVNAELKLPITYDKRLREIGGGEFEGMLRSDVPKEALENPNKFGAESPRDVFTRMKSFFDELKKNKVDKVLIISHGYALNCALRVLNEPNLKMETIPTHKAYDRENPIPNFYEFKNAEVMEIDLYKGGDK